MSEDQPGLEPIDDAEIPQVLRNIVRDLQFTPLRYRWFGMWWWPIKAMMIRASLRPLLGSVLGPSMDPAAIAKLPPGITPGLILAAGLANYQFCARFDATPQWADTPDGDRIAIYDPDVET